MGVGVVADRPEHPGRERSVQLEGELVDVDVLEHVDQVAGVERDRRPIALDRRLDLALVVADLGRRGDHDTGFPVDADPELDDVRRRAGDERGQPDRLEQLLAIDDRAGRMTLRQDLLVVRELAVDEPAHEVDPLEMEQDLVLARRQDDIDRRRRRRPGSGSAR